MRPEKKHRCPYCCSPINGREGAPLLPGHLVICDGCAGPSAFDELGERLVVLGLGALSADVRDEVAREQAKIRARYAETGGVPPGYSWRHGVLCGECWEQFAPERAPVRVVGDELSPSRRQRCAFCREMTDSGIVRRMLRALSEDDFETIVTVPKSPEHDLVAAIRHWADQEDARCACCGCEFYSRDGDDTCHGCRANYPYQRSLLRQRLVMVIAKRPVSGLDHPFASEGSGGPGFGFRVSARESFPEPKPET